jgi:hypothetical protein
VIEKTFNTAGIEIRVDLKRKVLVQICKKVRKSSPITGLNRPRGFQDVEAPRYQDNRYMKVL